MKAAPIQRIEPTGIRTSDAVYPLDIIVFATGFDAMTGPMLRMNITGRDGISLAEAWEAGPRTYLGLQIAGFPNLFTVTGPGSPSVLCNMPVAIEQHADWIADCIAHMHSHGLDRIEAAPEAVANWVERVNTAADATLLPLAKSSWYLGANVPRQASRVHALCRWDGALPGDMRRCRGEELRRFYVTRVTRPAKPGYALRSSWFRDHDERAPDAFSASLK